MTLSGSIGPIIGLNGPISNYRGLKIADSSGTEKWFAGANDVGNYIIRQSATTDLMTFSGGNVGIGTNSPTYPVHIKNTTTATSGGNYGMVGGYTVTPTSISTATSVGARFATSYTANVELSGALIGSQGVAVNSSASTIYNTVGSQGSVNNSTIGIISNASGIQGNVTNSSTGSIGNATGVQAGINNLNTGNITSAIGLSSTLNNATTGAITNSYELYTATTNNGTITNQYGIHQATASSKNYFAGNTGIGTANPATKLDVFGDYGDASLSSSSGAIATFTAATGLQTQFGAIYGGSWAAWI